MALAIDGANSCSASGTGGANAAGFLDAGVADTIFDATPQANSFNIVTVFLAGQSDMPSGAVTVTGLGATWDQVLDEEVATHPDGHGMRMLVYRAMQASYSTGKVRASWTAGEAERSRIQHLSITGALLRGVDNNGAAVLQHHSGEAVLVQQGLDQFNSGTRKTITLDALFYSANRTLFQVFTGWPSTIGDSQLNTDPNQGYSATSIGVGLGGISMSGTPPLSTDLTREFWWNDLSVWAWVVWSAELHEASSPAPISQPPADGQAITVDYRRDKRKTNQTNDETERGAMTTMGTLQGQQWGLPSKATHGGDF